MPPQVKAAYEEGVRRGLVKDAYAQGQLSGHKNAVSAFMGTMTEAVPFADEINAGVMSLGGMAQGKKPADAWREARDWQAGQQNAFAQDHPAAARIATGGGYSVQMLPMFLTGGTSNAFEPAAEQGLKALVKRVGVRTVKNATVGATAAAVNAAAGRGTVQERVQAANEAAPGGAVAGVVLPAVVTGSAKLGAAARAVTAPAARATARAANNAATKLGLGPFLDPREEVVSRLTEALKKDKITGEALNAALTEWQSAGGASPAFMDIVARNGGGQNTMALIRGAALKGPGRDVASKYANQVAVDLQDNAIGRTRALTRDTRTAPMIEQDVSSRIAANSQGPQVTPGQAGAQVHQRLNAGYDQADARVGQAYDAARAAAPEAAHLPQAEFPQVKANIREAVRDYDPTNVPRVAVELNRLDGLSTPTARDLFEARSRLSALSASRDPIEAGAAGKAVRALDAEINSAVDRGAFAGDPEVIGLWRNAIGERRAMGQQYQGNDLIQTLTERDRYGGGRANVVGPDDASNAILGRTGVSNRGGMTRDLARLRDQLGADSPEWRAVQQEAQARILGRDAGTERFGQAWDRFSHDNPELAQLLSGPIDRNMLTANRAQISGAVADRGAFSTGQGIVSAPSDQFAADVARVGNRRPLVQTGAARGLETAIERPAQNATGVLNRIATSSRSASNLENAFGPEAASRYRTSIGQLVDQVNNARFINPNSDSQTMGRLSDQALVEAIPQTKTAWVLTLIRKVKANATLTDAERELLVKLATTKADPGMIESLPRPPMQNAFMPSTRASVLAIPAGQTQSQNRR